MKLKYHHAFHSDLCKLEDLNGFLKENEGKIGGFKGFLKENKSKIRGFPPIRGRMASMHIRKYDCIVYWK